jgi:hypothetical protein
VCRLTFGRKPLRQVEQFGTHPDVMKTLMEHFSKKVVRKRPLIESRREPKNGVIIRCREFHVRMCTGLAVHGSVYGWGTAPVCRLRHCTRVYG